MVFHIDDNCVNSDDNEIMTEPWALESKHIDNSFFFFFKNKFSISWLALPLKINLSVIIIAFITISACCYWSLWPHRPNWKMVTSVLNSYFRTMMIFSKCIFQFNFYGLLQKQRSGSDWSVETLFQTSPSVLTCTLLTEIKPLSISQ